MYGIRYDSIAHVQPVDRSARRIALRSRRAAREAELIRHALEADGNGGVERERSAPPGSGHRPVLRALRARWV